MVVYSLKRIGVAWGQIMGPNPYIKMHKGSHSSTPQSDGHHPISQSVNLHLYTSIISYLTITILTCWDLADINFYVLVIELATWLYYRPNILSIQEMNWLHSTKCLISYIGFFFYRQGH